MKSLNTFLFFICFFSNFTFLIAQLPGFQIVNFQVGIAHTYGVQTNETGSGVAFFDYNNDNWEDMIFTGGMNDDALYKNNGDGTFTLIPASVSGLTAPIASRTFGVVTGDIDNDGYDDVLFSTAPQQPCYLYKNNGDGTFTDISWNAGIWFDADGNWNTFESFSPTMADVNLDGYLDIYISNWVDTSGFIRDSLNNVIGFAHDCAPNFLYLNNGDLTFTEVSNSYGVQHDGCSLVSAFTDPDNDRDLDLLIANDFGEWVNPDVFYRNDYPNPSFTDISTASGFNSQLYGMGIGIGDYDQDGDLDYYKTNIGRNVLLNNTGNSTFIDTTTFAGVEDTYLNATYQALSISWGAEFLDYDNDSYLDLVVANGMIPSLFLTSDSLPDRLFRNLGNGHFVDVAQNEGLYQYGLSRGVAYADYDNDGDLDIVFTCVKNLGLGIAANPFVFKNNLIENGSTKNWLRVKLEGTICNRNAIGTHITISVGGKSWVHEIASGGQGHNSQSSRIAHFGLGQTQKIDSLKIEWIGNSSPPQIFTGIAPNQMIKIVEGNSTYTVVDTSLTTTKFTPTITKNMTVYPNPMQDHLIVDFEIKKPANIEFEIISIDGKRIKQFSPQYYSQGNHQLQWDRKMNNGGIAPQGIYLLLLKTENEIREEQILVID